VRAVTSGAMRPRPAPAKADAIVVLGLRLSSDGRPRPGLVHRVRLGADLWRGGAAPLLVLSGGGDRDRSEAEVMRALAIAHGVPEAVLLVEPRSRTTWANAQETAALLRARGLHRVILVSDGYHLPRARVLFRAAGLAVVATAAPPTPPVLTLAAALLREAMAWVVAVVR